MAGSHQYGRGIKNGGIRSLMRLRANILNTLCGYDPHIHEINYILQRMAAGTTRRSVFVVPVITSQGLDFWSLSKWMESKHFVYPKIPEQWTRFIRTLESPCTAQRVPFMVENLPENFVCRSSSVVLMHGCIAGHRRIFSEIPASALGTEIPCPHCGKPVRLNLFTINADWRQAAKAWQRGKE